MLCGGRADMGSSVGAPTPLVVGDALSDPPPNLLEKPVPNHYSTADAPLPDGPLDIVGDNHGESEAFRDLLNDDKRLGGSGTKGGPASRRRTRASVVFASVGLASASSGFWS